MTNKFAREELLEGYRKRDREKAFPPDLWKKMGSLGLIGMRVSPEHGGQGANCVMQGIAAEELGTGDPNMSLAATVVAELCGAMLEQGSKEIKRKFLEPMLKGELVPSIAVTEPECGTDAAAMKTKAIEKDDVFILNGEKSGVTMTNIADFVVLFAKTDPEARARGVSTFVLPSDFEGVSRQTIEDMGGKNLRRGNIALNNVEVPKEYLLGEKGEGFKMIMSAFDISRTLIALICIGAAKITLDETIEYTKERNAFGNPLAKFEDVSFTVAEHYSVIEAARLLCYKALVLSDEDKPHTKEANMAKWMAPKKSAEAIHDCLLLHGHYGYTKDYPIEQRLRDIIGLEIGDGTAQASKLVVTRELFGKEYLPYK